MEKKELIEGIKENEESELNKINEKVKRENNKKLPDLILLSHKRKKENLIMKKRMKKI